jgi:hypothetical protein
MNIRRLASMVLGVTLLITVNPANCNAVTGLGIGARLGFVSDYEHPLLDEQGIEPEDLSMYGAHITLLSIAKLSVELAGEYSARDFQREINLDLIGMSPALVDFKVRDYAGYATARYKLITGQLGVHLGGGLNIHRMTYSKELPYAIPGFGNVVEIPVNDWYSGFHVLAGVSFGLPMIPFRVFAEGRIAKINVSDDAARQTTLLVGATFGAF